MPNAYSAFSTRTTPQNQRATADQVQNNAGGYVFRVSPLSAIKRFLILGSSEGTYYQSAEKLTRENAEQIIAFASTNHRDLVDLIVDVSTGGKAPKQQPAIFALAIAASTGTAEERAYALSKVNDVCRTGTTLFQFAGFVEQFRGWGPALRRAIGSWYLERPTDSVAYQAVKYRSREGWTHRDLLRLSHPKTTEPERANLFEWIVRETFAESLPKVIEGYMKAETAPIQEIPQIVRDYRLTWEALPDAALKERETWEALLDVGIPTGALLRQLPRLTNLGIVAPFNAGRTNEIAAQLVDPERLKKARIHPVNVLVAARTYASGHGRSQTWQPVASINQALDAAFYAAFGAVEPAGKRTLIGLDVSGSMGSRVLPDSPLTARDIGSAMASVITTTEPDSETYGFTSQSGSPYSWGRGRDTAFTHLDIKGRRLNDIINSTSALPFGNTDCALPMLEATKNKWLVDTFVVITDSETWHGPIHPHQALEQYRQKSGVNAKLIVLATTPTSFSIANPADPLGQLDIAGFGSDVPQLVTEFSRGF